MLLLFVVDFVDFIIFSLHVFKLLFSELGWKGLGMWNGGRGGGAKGENVQTNGKS